MSEIRVRFIPGPGEPLMPGSPMVPSGPLGPGTPRLGFGAGIQSLLGAQAPLEIGITTIKRFKCVDSAFCNLDGILTPHWNVSKNVQPCVSFVKAGLVLFTMWGRQTSPKLSLSD